MVHGRGPCSDTTRTSKEAQHGTAVPVDQDDGNGSLQKCITGFKKCCMSYEMGGMEDEEEVRNVINEHENVRQKIGILKALKLRQVVGMVKRARLVRLNKG
jgi:hypothetical protein